MIKKILPIVLFIFSLSVIGSLIYFNLESQDKVVKESTERQGPELSMTLSEEEKLEMEIFHLEKKVEEKEEEIQELKDKNDIKDLLIGLSGFILNILSIIGIVRNYKKKSRD